MESPAWMTVEPGADLVLLVRRVIVEDHVDGLVRGHLALDAVEEADELLMAVALHVLPDDRSIQNVERREQRGRAVAFVVYGSWCRRGPSSSAGRAGCGRVLGSATSRRSTAPPHGPVDRHTSRRYRRASRRRPGRSRARRAGLVAKQAADALVHEAPANLSISCFGAASRQACSKRRRTDSPPALAR